MKILPFKCPRQGHEFVRSSPIGDKRPYSCSCGQVILSTTVVDYIDPVIDKDGKRVKLVLDLVIEAWAEENMSPIIDAIIFDRRLAALEQKPKWWKRFFRTHARAK